MASTRATLSRHGPGDGRGDLRHLEGVGQAGALVVGGEDEDLGLAGEAPEGGGVQDAVPVALEAGPPLVGLLRLGPLPGASGPGRSRRQRRGLRRFPGRPVHHRGRADLDGVAARMSLVDRGVDGLGGHGGRPPLGSGQRLVLHAIHRTDQV